MIFRPLFWKIFVNARAYALRGGGWLDRYYLALWLGLAWGSIAGHSVWLLLLGLTVASIGTRYVETFSRRPRCWRCGAFQLYRGPTGGMSFNALCARCGSRFTITPALRHVDVVTPGPREITPSERELFHLDTGEPM